MLSTVDDVRDAYIADRPRYERLTHAVETVVAQRLATSGIPASVSGRTKDVHKLVIKAMKRDSVDYESIGDKAGVRVVVGYSDLVEGACDVVEASLVVHERENKRENQDPASLSYLATHFDVGLPSDHPLVGEDPWFGTARSEVQVLTRAESLWADASHELLYKPIVALPSRERRAVMRLVALAEIVDNELEMVRRVRSELDHKGVFVLIASLERFHYQWTSREPDRQLSADIVERLIDADADFIRQCSAALEEWFSANRGKLLEIAERYEPDERASPILFQPEALLIFLMLDSDSFKTRDMWSQFAADALLDRLEFIWGFSA